MRASRMRVIGVLAVALALASPADAQNRPSLTLDNRSGADALVRLAGPTTGMIDVPNTTARTVTVRGGTYQLYIRYGRPGKYRYTRGEVFTVEESARGVEHVTITLHAVVNGNYDTDSSDEAEFNGRPRRPMAGHRDR